MISFRSHVISLIAVFLALAVGVVLGGGPLAEVSQSVGSRDDDRPTPADRAELAAAEGAADQGDEVALALGERAYADGLDGTTVAVVLLPGARLSDTVAEQIEVAGGQVGGVVQFEDSLLQPGEKNLVDTLGAQLQTQVGKDAVSDGATTYDRLGQLVAAAVATQVTGAKAPDEVGDAYGTVTESLETAGLATVVEEPEAPSPVVLLVAPAEVDQAADPIVTGLAAGLTRGSAGTVLASPGIGGDDPGERLEQAGGDTTIVTGAGRPAGAVAAVLALSDAARS